MNHLLAWSFIISASIIALIPVFNYIRAKYYYVDTTPIRYWLNKKQKAKKRYKTLKKRNRKHLVVNKIHNYSYNRYWNSRLTKLNK